MSSSSWQCPLFDQQESLCGAKKQEVWTGTLFKCSIRWPFQVQITVLWRQLRDWTVCWITLGKISLIGLNRYVQESHFARLRPPHVIFLTHAIKDYLCEQITDQNPWPSLHLESRAPSCWTNNNPFFDRLVQSTICCNAEARGVLQDLSYPFKDDHSSRPQEDVTTVHSGDSCRTLTLWVWLYAFLRRIQQSMKHVRLMIFCNWISEKAGDKVPHTPLILPISTAGLKRALLCRWIWRKGREWSLKRGRMWVSRMKRGADCGTTPRGRTASEGAPTCPDARGLITISALGARRVRGGRGAGDSCEKERGRQSSTCQSTTANIQTVAVRSGLGLCLHNKQGRLALLNHRKQFTLGLHDRCL